MNSYLSFSLSLSLSDKLWIMSCSSIWHACAFTLFWHLSVNWQNWLSPKINRFKRSHFFLCHLHTLCLRTHTLLLPQRAPFHASISLSLSLSLLSTQLFYKIDFWKSTARPLNPTRTLFQAALSLSHSTTRPHPSNPTRTLFQADLSFNINFETKFSPIWNPQISKGATS